MEIVTIYSDGACRANPTGAGGYGVVVLHHNDDKERTIQSISEYTKSYDITTNNRMELLAAIVGLESLTKPSDVSLYSDSKYVVDAFNQGWIDSWVASNWTKSNKKKVKNVDLWQRMLSAKEIHKVTFVWVKGHAGNPYNERCDYLAASSADGVKFEKHDDGKLYPIKEEKKEDPLIAILNTIKE